MHPQRAAVADLNLNRTAQRHYKLSVRRIAEVELASDGRRAENDTLSIEHLGECAIVALSLRDVNGLQVRLAVVAG